MSIGISEIDFSQLLDLRVDYLFKLVFGSDKTRLISLVNPDISLGFARAHKRAWIRGARSEGDEGILTNTSRRPNKRNAVDMPSCAPEVEIP